MARKVTPMSVKVVAAAVAAVGEGSAVNVSAVCREAGVSRKTFYKWVARYRAEGLEGLEERSRRPRRSPGQVPSEVEDQVVRLRKELRDAGLDHGATTIRWHLGRSGMVGVPSVAGVHRILVRRGLVDPQPKKRPKSSWRRFEAAAPNECWQIDATDWATAAGVARIFNIIDDHSRVLIRSRAVLEATSVEAWATFSEGAAVWGLPAGVLSDNGLCFSGKLRGFEVHFEHELREAGIRPFTGRPYHPQTTGKVERFQQTLKKWLRRQPLAQNVVELQAQLDEFTWTYNHERPHHGIGHLTPIDRWNASPAATPTGSPLNHPTWPTRLLEGSVSSAGVVQANRLAIHIGAEWEGQQAQVQVAGTRANVFIDGHLVRHLELDLDRVYQPSGRPPGGPRRSRLRS
jgi:transposase InsO family protein